MRNILLTTTAIAALGIAPAMAQDTPMQADEGAASDRQEEQGVDPTTTESQGLGATAGGATGATAGAVLGGPIGAVAGGFAGAVIGAEASVPEPAVDYAVDNPVEPVALDGPVEEGMSVPDRVALEPIEEHPDYAYVYSDDGRPVIVDIETRQVVHSPGYAIPEETISYVETNPLDPVSADARLEAGATVPETVEVVEVPENPTYGYVYTETGPVLVEQGSRTVVWVR